MHRIDTANARPDANGPAKAGFSDNTDLQGQDPTYLSPDWFNSVQEELAGVIEASGAALSKTNNGQLLTALHAIFASDAQLTEVDNRLTAAITTLSVVMQQAIISERTAERDRIWPVGKGTYISYSNDNPATVLGFGSWQLISKGQSLVGLSDDSSAPDWTKAVGNTAGAYEQTLTVDQIPQHQHKLPIGDVNGGGRTSQFAYGVTNNDNAADVDDPSEAHSTTMRALTGFEGGSMPHSIVQPSLVVAVWLRVG